MKENKCPNCGASIIGSDSKTIHCEYCNSTFTNENYREKPVINTELDSRINQTNSKATLENQTKFNGCLFVILLFFFWPAAIFYLVICSITKKN